MESRGAYSGQEQTTWLRIDKDIQDLEAEANWLYKGLLVLKSTQPAVLAPPVTADSLIFNQTEYCLVPPQTEDTARTDLFKQYEEATEKVAELTKQLTDFRQAYTNNQNDYLKKHPEALYDIWKLKTELSAWVEKVSALSTTLTSEYVAYKKTDQNLEQQLLAAQNKIVDLMTQLRPLRKAYAENPRLFLRQADAMNDLQRLKIELCAWTEKINQLNTDASIAYIQYVKISQLCTKIKDHQAILLHKEAELQKMRAAYRAHPRRYVRENRESLFEFLNLKYEIKLLQAEIKRWHKKIRQYPALLETTTKIFAAMNNFIGTENTEIHSSDMIFNATRGTEIFRPLVLTDVGKRLGLYVYPWLSNTEAKQLDAMQGFKLFHSCGCLLSSCLVGIDENGGQIPFLKHGINFWEKQKIQWTVLDPEKYNPYEEMLFSEWNKLVAYINQFSQPGNPKILVYHLPHYDYVLFGMYLYVKDRITKPALDDFFQKIYEKKCLHEDKLKELCDTNNIKLIIKSPFENLFGALKKEDYNLQTILQKINTTATDEETLTQDCIQGLIGNENDLAEGMIWQDFSKIMDFKKVNTIDQLLKIANTTVLAFSSKYFNDYEVCSYLPLSEEAIQRHFAIYLHKLKKIDPHYAHVFNATVLDPIYTYGPGEKHGGLLFYFRLCCKSISNLISKYKILQQLSEQLGKQPIATFWKEPVQTDIMSNPETPSPLRKC